jgi:small-conductance mechanosensitive channel
VRFLEFGDSGLQFELRAWSTSLLHRKGTLISALNFAIYERFAAHGIQIPFPQRDLHIRSAPPDWSAPR